MIRCTDQIAPEGNMALCKKVGWSVFPTGEAKACVENMYMEKV